MPKVLHFARCLLWCWTRQTHFIFKARDNSCTRRWKNSSPVTSLVAWVNIFSNRSFCRCVEMLLNNQSCCSGLFGNLTSHKCWTPSGCCSQISDCPDSLKPDWGSAFVSFSSNSRSRFCSNNSGFSFEYPNNSSERWLMKSVSPDRYTTPAGILSIINLIDALSETCG